ncbi:CGGC domain-containing protein [Clostridium sporogenes]|uniref:CGGC domain-containing protein n=1 Tax=Clostridium sporogenes TaxID=1509 RepID=A0ABD6RV60_CLOSG|nr:CGGC domain-containing protein [Clostridium sporogenes]EKS4343862.1 CGGC domain-containing protein [Clostridium botulinum]EKS4396250.1 CGGC domain-containing protein [Clostridium botulinum]MCR1974286.1 CGGC domain-containing protein [Clostridium sporogenes]MCW6078380.1 CGGC domain-containing protein [Clostridium sporogenes]NFG95647.1 CGGC domain-containing protein [Clostridium sporogenes]
MAIAIMACRKLVGKCSGTGCFKAYNDSTAAFKIYENNKPVLSSFFYCIGCEKTKTKGEDWEHKISQLKKNNVDTIHLSVCIKVECNKYEEHERILKNRGFKIVNGSHE